MITLEKLDVYRMVNGNIDGYSRSRSDDQSGITDEDWRLINELVQALFIISSGQAAPEFTASILQRIATVSADEQTQQALHELAIQKPQ